MRHAVRAATGALLAVLCLLLLPGAATAAGETLQGALRNGGEPVEGVTITVTTADGEQVGEDETDETGAFVIELPEAGEYTISLDEDTLPDDVAIREGRSASVTLPVNVGQQRSVLFPLGESSREVRSDLDRLPQLALEGLNFGLIIALAAVGLSLIYGTTGLVNFAHGELVTLGALVAYFFNAIVGLQLVPAAIIAVLICAAMGGAQDFVLWRPLRRKGTGLIAMLVVTIGLALFARGFYLYLFGGGSRPYVDYQLQPATDLGPVALAPKDAVTMGLCVLMLLLVAFALLRTRIGKATRAVADNPALAASSGIDVERVISTVWIAGAGLAGMAGILLALGQQASFQTGFQILLLVFAGVTLGGLGTAFGALVGSVAVGVFTQVSTLVIPTELKNAGALAVLILILLFRPQGILGRAERVG